MEDIIYAFPVPYPRTGDDGMLLRDWFSGVALAGLIGNDDGFLTTDENHLATKAYAIAAAMMEEREKKKE